MRSGYDENYNLAIPYHTDLFEEITDLRFQHHTFKMGPALISEDGTIQKYNGEAFDAEYWVLAPEGWTHEHCYICNFAINEQHTYWLNDDDDCLCDSCYEYFVKRMKGSTNGSDGDPNLRSC